MSYVTVTKKEFKPDLDAIKDDHKARQDKEFFRETGTQIYCGRQGSGKTICAVKHCLELHSKYPKSILVTNLRLTGLIPLTFKSEVELKALLRHIDPRKQYVLFHDIDELSIALTSINNGFRGVIYLIDEIHTYLNSLDSKNIPMWIFTEISQQRKQRKCIVGTSQLFSRSALALREQCENVFVCHTYGGILTTYKAYYGDDIESYNAKRDKAGTTLSYRKWGFFLQSRELRNAYDTYQKVVSGIDVPDYSQNLAVTITEKRKKFGR